MNLLKPIILTFCVAQIAGCATVTRGSTDVLEINTDPAGAQVETTNGFSCTATPCAIKMKRKSTFVANITKPGCAPMAVNVTHKTANAGAAGMAGNVLVGGIIGLGVDASTGATQDLVPNPISVKLDC